VNINHQTTVYAAAFIHTYSLFADTAIFSLVIYPALFVLAINEVLKSCRPVCDLNLLVSKPPARLASWD